MTLDLTAFVAPFFALVAGTLMLMAERRRLLEMSVAVVLVPLAAAGIVAPTAGTAGLSLVLGLVVALLARERDSLLLSECALKLLWVLGAALALSWAGVELVTIATGTAEVREQWSVLAMGIDADFLWRIAVPLSLLLGLVLLGGAPFHFWAADLLHGAPVWLAPLAVVALQVCGAQWLSARVADIDLFPAGAHAVSDLFAISAALAFAVGAMTLPVQRRPERRVGTLGSLNGGLLLALLASREGGGGAAAAHVTRWAAHLVVALSGAGIVARLLPIADRRPAPPPVLFRRHLIAGIAGLYAWFSLAGVPGTPGARMWLDAARAIAESGRPWVMLSLAVAWIVSISVAARQLREAIGVVTKLAPPARPVPWPARAALVACAVGLLIQLRG